MSPTSAPAPSVKYVAGDHVYYCTARQCPKWHEEVKGEDPGYRRDGTGKVLFCACCGKTLAWLRQEPAVVVNALTGKPVNHCGGKG